MVALPTLIDERLAMLGGSWFFVIVIAGLLGLRHATDPDHLTAMLLIQLRGTSVTPFRLGLAWGAGHAMMMIGVGVPLMLFVTDLPAAVQKSLEIAVGVVIALMALRVLSRLILVRVHSHRHTHTDGVTHAHPHVHGAGVHTHRARTSRSAFGIGLLHGAGGSAGVVALLLARVDGALEACSSLVVIAALCAISMAGCSWVMCRGLERGTRTIAPEVVTAIGGLLSLAFGMVYAISASGAV